MKEKMKTRVVAQFMSRDTYDQLLIMPRLWAVDYE